MMKKGFTLAEVLVTLGVIGVVAALVLPGLVSNTTDAQIGPKLAKAVSTFEQANEALLTAYSVDSLTDAGMFDEGVDYRNELSNHMNMTIEDLEKTFTTKDGISFTYGEDIPDSFDYKQPHKQHIGAVTVDINGRTQAPNIGAVDIFGFALYNDGSLRPYGATNWKEGEAKAASGGDEHWTSKCPNGAVPTEVIYCAGSIFANNLKVMYK